MRPERLEAVKRELAAAQVFRLTVSDVLGVADASGRDVAPAPRSAADAYAGHAPLEPAAAGVRRVKLEVAVNEDFVEPTVRAILRGARGDGPDEHASGDGKVFVLPLEEAIRIRTGERGPDAI